MCIIDTKAIIDFATANGFKAEVKQSGSRFIDNPSSLMYPKSNSISFFNNKRWTNFSISFAHISLLIVSVDLEEQHIQKLGAEAAKTNTSILATDQPRRLFIEIVEAFFLKKDIPEIHDSVTVPTSCEIGKDVTIRSGVKLGENVVIGDKSVISENCVIGNNTRIGRNTYIAPGVAIGQRGFGYERKEDGSLIHFPHIGSVVIGDNVEIGANTCIDRGTLDDTVIGNGVKIDNLCHISHNVILENDCVVIANSMIGGSTVIGARAWVAPSSSILNGITISPDATVGMGSVVVKPVTEPTTVVGSPAMPISAYIRNKNIFVKLIQKEIDKEYDS